MYVIGVIGGWLPFWIFGHDLAFDFGPGKVMPSYWILAAQLLSLQPILAPYVPFNAAMWTVGVEEVLYRLVPLLTKPRLAVLYALAAVSALYYVIAPQLICYSANPSAYGRLLWAFVLGSMLFSYSQNRVVRLVVLAGAPALLAFYERDAPTFSPLIAAIGGTAIIWSGRVAISPRMAAAFEYLGDLSYPLYVLHFPVAWIVCFMWILIPAPAVVGISLILSVVFLHAVDRPLRKLGRRPIKTVALNPYAEPSPTTA